MHTLSASLCKPLDGIDKTLETIENVQLMIILRLNLDIFSNMVKVRVSVSFIQSKYSSHIVHQIRTDYHDLAINWVLVFVWTH